MAKIKSFGTTVSVATNAVGGLTDIGINGTEVTFVDTTSHDSSGGFREFVGGLKDGGTLELSGKFDTSDTGQDQLRGNAGVSAAVVVTFSDSSNATFNAIIGGFSTTSPLDDTVGFTCSLKITGAITWADS